MLPGPTEMVDTARSRGTTTISTPFVTSVTAVDPHSMIVIVTDHRILTDLEHHRQLLIPVDLDHQHLPTDTRLHTPHISKTHTPRLIVTTIGAQVGVDRLPLLQKRRSVLPVVANTGK
jgi:hypothetical protein